MEAAKEHLLVHAICTANPSALETKPTPAPALGRRAKLQAQQQLQQQLQPTRHTASASASELPQPLLDLIVLLPPFLAVTPTSLPADSVALLLSNPPFSDFPALVPRLASLVSSTLHASAVHLARVANPSTNPSYVHRSVPALPAHAVSLAASVAERKASVARARVDAASALASLLQRHARALDLLVRALEAKHGPIARSLEFRAAEVALTAQKQAAEAEAALWRARRDVYPPEAVRALANYAAHLRDARGRLGEAIRSRKAELDAYGVGEGSDGKGKERTMREMARVYREMRRQVEDVRVDLERLGRA